MLEVSGLRVSYGGIQAVRGITFHVQEGEMVALIGADEAQALAVCDKARQGDILVWRDDNRRNPREKTKK